MKLFASLSMLFLAFTLAARAQSSLQVVTVSPRGTVAGTAESQRIIVTFNQPMVALSGLSAQPMATGPFTLAPTATGTFRWLGTSSMEFQPEKPLSLATKFTVTIPAGLKAVSGATLAQAYTWSFESARPAVLGTLPGEGAQWIKVDNEIYLRFHQPVNAAAAASFLEITASPKGTKARSARGVSSGGAATKVAFAGNHPAPQTLVEIGEMGENPAEVLVLR